MKVTFEYVQEKDIWCLETYGKRSMNSSNQTEVYKKLITQYGDSPIKEEMELFIETYYLENKILIRDIVEQYQKRWDAVSSEYQKRAEQIFGVRLPSDVHAYITINNRCPYSVEENMFFVSVPSYPVKTAMHELWHFYTWYAFGKEQEEVLGKQKYNDIKEALTVLLNVECKDLLPEGVEDKGYLQHVEIREKILAFWDKEKDIKKLWKILTED